MNGSPREPAVHRTLPGCVRYSWRNPEHREKVDHLVVPETAAGEANPLVYGIEDSMFAKMLDEKHDFPQPTGRGGNNSEEVWMITEHRAILVISTSLLGKICILPSKEAHFIARSLQATSRCAIRGPATICPPASEGKLLVRQRTSASPQAALATRTVCPRMPRVRPNAAPGD